MVKEITIPQIKNNNYTNLRNSKSKTQKNNYNNQTIENKKIWLYFAGAAATLGGIYLATRGKKVKSNASNVAKNPVQNISKYINALTYGIKQTFNIDVNPQSLSCVMDKQELLEAVSKLSKENYCASAENIANGIFKADLHSHSVFSDGSSTVSNILDNVCDYANKLNKKTGEKFIFALTDHDTADGVKEALKIISQSPDKFKNVKFVIGSEISYLMKSDKSTNPTETAELLTYGFNPFSVKVSDFFTNLKRKRENMVKNYINDLSKMFPNTKFSEEEYLNTFLKDKTLKLTMNSYWKLYHYGQIKTVLSDTAKAKGLEPEQYFKDIMSKAPKNLNLYEFKKAGLIENWINENPKIIEINNKYRPEISSTGKIIQKSENLLEDITNTFKNEENCTIGFAHPYYLIERTSNVANAIKEVHSQLGDLLKLAENYHQAYSDKIIQEQSRDIEYIAKLCRAENLIPIGGRDNHKPHFLEKALYEN